MKKFLKISVCLSILLLYQCEKECFPLQFDYFVNGILTKANFEKCPDNNSFTLIKDTKNNNINFYEFFTNYKNKLFFTSQNGETSSRIDTNKTLLFLPNQISNCNSTGSIKLKVDFFTRSTPNDVRKKVKMPSISGQVDKFSLKVNEEVIIDSIAIDVISLSKPCVLQFSDNFNGTTAKFFVKINQCGIIEHELFQFHWSNINSLYNNKRNYNLFKGEIKVLFAEEL